MKNCYCKSSRISEKKIREIVRYFATDLTTLQTAELSRLNRNTINRFYRALRERIHTACEAQCPMFGVVEVDESFFGAKRVKGKRGRGAYGKTALFGIFERHQYHLKGKFIRKSSQTVKRRLYRELYGVKLRLAPS